MALTSSVTQLWSSALHCRSLCACCSIVSSTGGNLEAQPFFLKESLLLAKGLYNQ